MKDPQQDYQDSVMTGFASLKLTTLFTYVGFVCSCGLYEFGGIFWMTYFNPFIQTYIGVYLGEGEG